MRQRVSSISQPSSLSNPSRTSSSYLHRNDLVTDGAMVRVMCTTLHSAAHVFSNVIASCLYGISVIFVIVSRNASSYLSRSFSTNDGEPIGVLRYTMSSVLCRLNSGPAASRTVLSESADRE